MPFDILIALVTYLERVEGVDGNRGGVGKG